MFHYIFLIDTSYSMNSYINKVIFRLNNYIQKIKEKVREKVVVSVVQFNDDMRFVFVEVPIYNFPLITREMFIVEGTTALYDTMGSLICFFCDPHTMYDLTIISDGDDNASVNYDKDYIDNMYKQLMEEYGNWKITHYNTELPSIEPAEYIKIDMDNLDNLLTELSL